MHQNAGNCIYIFFFYSGGETPRPPAKMSKMQSVKACLYNAKGHLYLDPLFCSGPH